MQPETVDPLKTTQRAAARPDPAGRLLIIQRIQAQPDVVACRAAAAARRGPGHRCGGPEPGSIRRGRTCGLGAHRLTGSGSTIARFGDLRDHGLLGVSVGWPS